jgi:hypothetical protein
MQGDNTVTNPAMKANRANMNMDDFPLPTILLSTGASHKLQASQDRQKGQNRIGRIASRQDRQDRAKKYTGWEG